MTTAALFGSCHSQCSPQSQDLSRSIAKDEIGGLSKFRGPRDQGGTIRYIVDLNHPMAGPPLRVGGVLYNQCGKSDSFERATLALFANGFTVRFEDSFTEKPDGLSIAWSPFSLVQACRLHSVEADLATPSLRLFKVSIFHHGSTHFFAVEGEDADLERTRWVADASRALRHFTQSLFQPFELRTQPVPTVPATGTRILAGYLLKCEKRDVMLVYGELHALQDGRADFVLYEDDSCQHPLMPCNFRVDTPVSEHVAVDCSCFTVDCWHFTARTSAEKSLWLRVISNLKVKMRHGGDPKPGDLHDWRSSIASSVSNLSVSEELNVPRQRPQLPRRRAVRSGLMKVYGDCDDPMCDHELSRASSRLSCEAVKSHIIALGELP